MKSSLLLSLLASIAPQYVCPHTISRPVIPKVKGTPRVLGLVADPQYMRDSCGSSNFGDRTFWTCRDTQLVQNGRAQGTPLISSTASYSDHHSDGTPNLVSLPNGVNPWKTTILSQYGTNSIEQAFFPVLPGEGKPPSGHLQNGSRYALWPDQPPMVAERNGDGSILAYTWIEKAVITDLGRQNPYPATTLYRTNYSPSVGDTLPNVTVVNEEFYAAGDIPFGNYGNVVMGGVAYLYGQANETVALAKVPSSSVEDQSQYQYYVHGTWTKEKPTLGQDGINIPNVSAGGQGTYYYSALWQSYVWIGAPDTVGPNFYITTAPAPEGPWIQPFKFWSGVAGDYSLGAYSLQAHPALTLNSDGSGVYMTYTKVDVGSNGRNVYTTPLVYVEWD